MYLVIYFDEAGRIGVWAFDSMDVRALRAEPAAHMRAAGDDSAREGEVYPFAKDTTEVQWIGNGHRSLIRLPSAMSRLK